MILSLLQAATPTDFGLTIESVFARQIPARARSLIRIDPVEYELIQGTLKPAAPWENRPITGWKTAPSGYVWFRIKSPRKQILQLNINGASMAYVNGEPRVGDVYGYGAYFIPVAMKQGMNDILVYGFRGDATLNWRKPEAEIDLDRFDATLPDYNTDTKKAQGQWGGFVVHNNSERPRTVWLKADGNGASEKRLIPPLGTIKVPTPIPASSAAFLVTLREGQNVWATKTFKLQPRKTGEPYRRTFISEMDGSAQYYAVNPSSKPNPKVAVLSLHGASVEAIGQAQAYGQKDFCDIICPTNRRPFGFNWETVGRMDALEVLADAQSKGKYDPDRIMLTGHSMGGHGTWHLGAHYPDRFAAIGACAGWVSFDSYAGGANYDVKDPVQALLKKGNLASDTLQFLGNYAHFAGVYICHGAADETVPVTEARTMRDALKGIAKVSYHEEPGAGHWFDNHPEPGADSVDWNPMFDLFRVAKMEPMQAGKFRFADPNLEASFRLGWATKAMVPFEPMDVEIARDGATWSLSTKNVERLTLDRPGTVVLDGQAFSPKEASTRFARGAGGKWSMAGTGAPDFDHRGFNSIYRDRITFVAPEKVTAAQSAWAWTKIRYDQEQLWYRANATPPVEFESKPTIIKEGFCPSYVFYGGPSKAPGAAAGDTAVFYVSKGLAEITGTSMKGRRLTERFPLFSPGVSYPDLLRVDLSMLKDGSKGIRSAAYEPNWAPVGE